MKNRRTFLTALGFSGMTLALAGRTEAQMTPAASASPSAEPPQARPEPLASTSPVAPSKPPSALALATAATMRKFDPKLTDGQLEIIARGIDARADVGKRLNPKKKRLRNSDEPGATFAVRG